MEGNKTKEVSDWGEDVTTSAPKEVSDWGEEVTTEPLKKKEFIGQQPTGESLQPYQAATQPSGLSSLSEAKINVPEGERGIEQPKAEVEPVKKEEIAQYNVLPNQKLTGDKLYTTNPKSGVTTFKTLSQDELEKYRQAAQPKGGFQEFAQAKIESEKQRLAELPKKEKEPTADDLKQRVVELDNLSAKNIDEIKNIDIQLGIISNKQQSLSGMPRLMYASQEANKLFAQQIALKKQRDMLVMKQQAYDTKTSEAMGLLTNQETQRLVEESNAPFWGTIINGIKTNAEEIKDAIPYIKDFIDIGAQTTGALPTDYNSMFSKMVANKDLRKNELEKAYVGYKATAEAEKMVEGAGLTDNLPLYKFRKYAGQVFGGMAIPVVMSAGASAITGGTGAIIPLTNASLFGTMGLGSGALNTYFIARENGLSPDDAIIASERGALIGLATQAGLGLTMGKAGHFLNSKFNTAIKPLTATATKLGLESIGTGTEMAGAKFVENVATGAATALPMKPTEGLGESFLEGMLFHATAHFGGVPSYLKSKSLFRAVDKVKTPEGISRMRKQIVDSNKGGLINNTQMVQLTKQLDDAIDFGKYIPEDITDEEIRDRFFDTIMKYNEYRKLQKESPDALKGYYDEKLSGLDNVINGLIAKQKELDTIKQQQYEKATKTGERATLQEDGGKPGEERLLGGISEENRGIGGDEKVREGEDAKDGTGGQEAQVEVKPQAEKPEAERPEAEKPKEIVAGGEQPPMAEKEEAKAEPTKTFEQRVEETTKALEESIDTKKIKKADLKYIAEQFDEVKNPEKNGFNNTIGEGWKNATKEQIKSLQEGYWKNVNTEKAIAEAYHKAKEDGSNPELVKAVEDLIGKPQEYEKAKEDGEPMPKGVSGVRAEGEGGKESAELRAEEEKQQEVKKTIFAEEKQKDENAKLRPEGEGDRGGRDKSRKDAPLKGSPNVAGATGPDPSLVSVAEKYAKDNGIDLKRQSEYVEVDPKLGERLAQAYDEMEHNPKNPRVKNAYRQLIEQTKKQYQALIDAGYEFSFFDSKSDPYDGNPYNAMRDLRQNKKMAVYGTYDGYGTKNITEAEVENNPMLEDTGLRWKDQQGVEHPVLFNDLFRAVHDAFGHGLEGSGFRARGEENAWQAHVRLFTGDAIAAITSETRGQNSWVNFGKYGEKNRSAKAEDTIFAPQKIGLMPEWTWTEGRVGDMAEGAAEPTANQKLISDAIDITKQIANPKTNAPERKLLKEKMNEMLSTNPKIKYIFDNIEKIEKELSANLKDDFKKKGDC